jgi:hypothetical protein
MARPVPRGLSDFGCAPQPGDEAAHGPGGVGVAEGLNLAPELNAVRVRPALVPAADQVWNVGRQHLRRWSPLGRFRAGRCVAPQVDIDRRASDAQLPGDGGHREPLRLERVHGLIERDP